MIETINSFSTTVVAISAIASAFIALRMYKLENSRDLPASNFHCWISRDSFSFGTIGDWSTFANLKIAISNRSELPIYSLRIAVVSKSRIAIDDVLIVPKGEIIYFKDMDFVAVLKRSFYLHLNLSLLGIYF